MEDYLAIRKHIRDLPLSADQKQLLIQSILESKRKISNSALRSFCEELSNSFVEAYRNNKQISEDDRNVIRQALSLIANGEDLEQTAKSVKKIINRAERKRSKYKEQYDCITDYLNLDEVFEIAVSQCDCRFFVSLRRKWLCCPRASLIMNAVPDQKHKPKGASRPC